MTRYLNEIAVYVDERNKQELKDALVKVKSVCRVMDSVICKVDVNNKMGWKSEFKDRHRLDWRDPQEIIVDIDGPDRTYEDLYDAIDKLSFEVLVEL